MLSILSLVMSQTPHLQPFHDAQLSRVREALKTEETATYIRRALSECDDIALGSEFAYQCATRHYSRRKLSIADTVQYVQNAATAARDTIQNSYQAVLDTITNEQLVRALQYFFLFVLIGCSIEQNTIDQGLGTKEEQPLFVLGMCGKFTYEKALVEWTGTGIVFTLLQTLAGKPDNAVETSITTGVFAIPLLAATKYGVKNPSYDPTSPVA